MATLVAILRIPFYGDCACQNQVERPFRLGFAQARRLEQLCVFRNERVSFDVSFFDFI
jgi:hypothetical protein